MRAAIWHAHVEPAGTARTPLGITIAFGAAVVVVAALGAALVPESAAGMRFELVAMALTGFAAVVGDVMAAVARR